MAKDMKQKDTTRILNGLVNFLAASDDLSDEDIVRELHDESINLEKIMHHGRQCIKIPADEENFQKQRERTENADVFEGGHSSRGYRNGSQEEKFPHSSKKKEAGYNTSVLRMAATLLIVFGAGWISQFLLSLDYPQEILDRGPTVTHQVPTGTDRGNSADRESSPAPVVRGDGPELVIRQYKPSGEMPTVDEYSRPFSLGDPLQLQVIGPSSSKFLYVLEIGGDGHANIHTKKELEKVYWGWKITGPPPTETIILLVSTQELQTDMFIARINALGITPRIREGAQLVWRNRAWKILESRRELHDLKQAGDLTWAERVVEVLNSIEGLTFDGRTLYVAEKGRSS